jgi:hypothetical protein
MVILLINALFLFPASCSSTKSSKIDKAIEDKIRQDLVALENQKPGEIEWADKLKIAFSDSKPYWTNRKIYVQAGYLPARVKVKSNFSERGYLLKRGEIKNADIWFITIYKENDTGELVGSCDIKNLIFHDEPRYEKIIKSLIKQAENLKPFKDWHP